MKNPHRKVDLRSPERNRARTAALLVAAREQEKGVAVDVLVKHGRPLNTYFVVPAGEKRPRGHRLP